MLQHRVRALDIQGEWISSTNLPDFLQRTTLVPEIEALFGLKLFELNPGLVDDLLIFTRHVSDFLRLRLRWLTGHARG